MESFLGVPVRIGGEVFGNLYLTDKQGAEEFDEADEQTLVALADWAAIAIANARRHGGVRGQRDELVRAVRAFETAEEIGRALAGETELERILELIVKRSRALVEARVMVLALREGDELVIRAASGEVDRSQLELAIPLEDSLSGHVLRSGRAQRLSDSTPGVRAVLPKAFGAHTELVVPLRFRGQGLGVLAALDRLDDGPEFSAEDERLMTAFASSAATAVATARDVAAQGLRRSLEAAERERSRWARELHDQTLQDLAGLKVMLSGARRAKEREQVDRILEQAIEHVQLGVDALRGLVTELRPAALDELGTAPALRALIDRTATTAGLEIELNVDLAYEQGRADTRHAPELESTMYRLVQEALTNVVKHAGASRVTVARDRGRRDRRAQRDRRRRRLSDRRGQRGVRADRHARAHRAARRRAGLRLAARRRHHRRRTDTRPAAPARTLGTNTRSPAAPPLGLTLLGGRTPIDGRPQQAHQRREVAVLGPVAARARRDVGRGVQRGVPRAHDHHRDATRERPQRVEGERRLQPSQPTVDERHRDAARPPRAEERRACRRPRRRPGCRPRAPALRAARPA